MFLERYRDSFMQWICCCLFLNQEAFILHLNYSCIRLLLRVLADWQHSFSTLTVPLLTLNEQP